MDRSVYHGCTCRKGGMRMQLTQLAQQIRDREEGQALVEYALILSLVSIVAIGALTAIGTNVTAILDAVATALT
jgi:pilus assembly protein Flp/PilA